MAESSDNILVETSAVLPALSMSVSAHNKVFNSTVGQAKLWGSRYIRMEVVRKWVCELIEFADLVRMSTTIDEALQLWSERYGRKPKLASIAISWLMKGGFQLRNDQTAEMSLELCRHAQNLLWQYDRVFKSRISNRSKCQIGDKTPNGECATLQSDMTKFRKEFLAGVESCDVKSFLKLGHKNGPTAKALSHISMSATTQMKKIREAVEKLHVSSQDVNCHKCSTIGDFVIAIEQPSTTTLIHIDGSFKHLANVTGERHIPLASKIAAYKSEIGISE